MTNRHHIYLLAGSLLTLAALNSLPTSVKAADTLPPAIQKTVGATTTQPTTQTEEPNTTTTTPAVTQGHVVVIYREVGTRQVLAREYLAGDLGTAVQFDTSFYTQPYLRLGYTVTGNGTVNGSSYTASTQEFTVLLTPPAKTTTDVKTPETNVTTPTTTPSDTATDAVATKTPVAQPDLFAHRSMASVSAMVPAATTTVNEPVVASPAAPATKADAPEPIAQPVAVAPLTQSTASDKSTTKTPERRHATSGADAEQAPITKPHKAKRHTKDEQQQYPADTSSPIAAPAPTPGGGGGNGNAAPTGLAAYFVSLSGKIVFGISA